MAHSRFIAVALNICRNKYVNYVLKNIPHHTVRGY